MSWAKPTTVSLLSRAERRIDGVLTARRETRPVGYDPINDDDPLIADIAVIMIRYKESCLSECLPLPALKVAPAGRIIGISHHIQLRGHSKGGSG
jgi:hypothetical protein